MEIEELNLGFIWERPYLTLDGDDSFRKVWGEDWKKFREFLKNESLEKVIGLIIKMYKVDYPRSLYLLFSKRGAWNESYTEGEYDITDGIFLFRDDIDLVKYLFVEDMPYSLGFKELVIEFKSEYQLSNIVEESLNSIEFKKVQLTDSHEYILKEGPIENIRLSQNSFKLSLRLEV